MTKMLPAKHGESKSFLMKTDLYNLLYKHSCNKGRAWLEKNKSKPLAQVVEWFFTDKIDFLRFITFRILGQKILFDESVKNEVIRAIATDLADPDCDVYSAKAILLILNKHSHPDLFNLEKQ
jgi:hypothetical protein